MNTPNANVTHLTAAERMSAEGRSWQPRVYHGAAAAPARSAEQQPQRKKFVAKGHDSQLQEAQFDKYPVEITTQAGETISGTISRRDKFTITVKLASGKHQGQDLIVYKHAIESVLIVKEAATAALEG